MVDRYTRQPMSFLLCVLATWRVTHLLVEEDGPADAVLRVRRAAGSSALGRLMDCFYCTSIWVALPLAATLVRGSSMKMSPGSFATSRRVVSPEGVVTWLALSGAACLLEQATRPDGTHALVEDLGTSEADGLRLASSDSAATSRAAA